MCATNAGSSAQTLNADEYLENGDFRAKLQATPAGNWGVTDLVIYKASDNAVFFRKAFHGNPKFENSKSIGFDTSNESEIWLTYSYGADYAGPAGTMKWVNISNAAGCTAEGWKPLNSAVKPTKSVYFKLEEDGTLAIYSGTGGTKILKWGTN